MCADVAKVTSLRVDRQKNRDGDSGWLLDAANFINTFNGPALLVSGSCEPILRNTHADVLADALENDNVALYGLVQRALDTQIPLSQKLTITATAGARQFEAHAIPLLSKKGTTRTISVLLFGRESTLDNNLTKALVESRQMFKDMIGCSPDFAWETDANGTFRYVSPRGAFGYRAHELTGRQAKELLAEGGLNGNPFITPDRLEEKAIVLICADGSRTQTRVTATPILSQQGEWLGTRGLCRDVNDLERTEHARAAAQARLDLNMGLTGLMRDMVASHQLLTTMAKAIADSVDLPCLLFRRVKDGFVCEGASSGMFNADDLDLIARDIAKLAEGHRTKARRLYRITVNDTVFEILPSLHHFAINGALAVPHDDSPLEESTVALLNDACDQLSIALDLIGNREAVQTLTRTDELTGLLTADAFEEAVADRMTHQQRTGTPATLMLIDIDDLDAINERFGHPCGEAALKEIGEALTAHSRVADLACRIGGDRFALWLENASDNGARQKARMIVNSIRELTVGPAGQALSLSVCVGGVMNAANSDMTLAQLKERGHDALKTAKTKGRGQWVIATDDQGPGDNNRRGPDHNGDSNV